MSKARELPGGWQMPGAGQCKICKCPTPGTDKAGKCPAVARGGGGCWAQVELTDALPLCRPCRTSNSFDLFGILVIILQSPFSRLL